MCRCSSAFGIPAIKTQLAHAPSDSTTAESSKTFPLDSRANRRRPCASLRPRASCFSSRCSSSRWSFNSRSALCQCARRQAQRESRSLAAPGRSLDRANRELGMSAKAERPLRRPRAGVHHSRRIEPSPPPGNGTSWRCVVVGGQGRRRPHLLRREQFFAGSALTSVDLPTPDEPKCRRLSRAMYARRARRPRRAALIAWTGTPIAIASSRERVRRRLAEVGLRQQHDRVRAFPGEGEVALNRRALRSRRARCRENTRRWRRRLRLRPVRRLRTKGCALEGSPESTRGLHPLTLRQQPSRRRRDAHRRREPHAAAELSLSSPCSSTGRTRFDADGDTRRWEAVLVRSGTHHERRVPTEDLGSAYSSLTSVPGRC